jgi:DhnA family fructose-bisphosphate aldolase class Ia
MSRILYGADKTKREFRRELVASDPIEQAVEQALRLDATCVVVNLFQIPEQPEVNDQCIRNIVKLKPGCDRYAMPLMIEPLVFQPNAQAGGYMVDGDMNKIMLLVRQAVELGADVIKADPTDTRLNTIAWSKLPGFRFWCVAEVKQKIW